jgi:hypothetical protein
MIHSALVQLTLLQRPKDRCEASPSRSARAAVRRQRTRKTAVSACAGRRAGGLHAR